MIKQRDEAIDILKGMLVFGMIFSHVSGLMSSHSDFSTKLVWLFTGLITFSGFMFSFGYVCQLSYFSKDFTASAQRMLLTALKPLIAFYISAIYWRTFINKECSFSGIVHILLLSDIPPFSEFLISFSLIIIISLLLFNPIQTITANPIYFWSVFILTLFTTFIPYDWVQINQIGLLIGTNKFPTFPVLQYFPIFLLGVCAAKKPILEDRIVKMIALISIILFILFYRYKQELPGRFPPSFLWITASIFFIHIYYKLAQYLSKWRGVSTVFSMWGKNVLFYLVISNIFIFTFRGSYQPLNINLIESFGLTLLILFTISFLTTIVVPSKIIIKPSQEPS